VSEIPAEFIGWYIGIGGTLGVLATIVVLWHMVIDNECGRIDFYDCVMLSGLGFVTMLMVTFLWGLFACVFGFALIVRIFARGRA
jgi:hypothetical protein